MSHGRGGLQVRLRSIDLGRGFIDWLGRVGRDAHLPSEIVSVANANLCALKIIGEPVSRLIQLDVIRARHDHHDHATVLALLDRTSKLRSFRP